jgi:hypothetical protein
MGNMMMRKLGVYFSLLHVLSPVAVLGFDGHLGV